MDDPKLQRVLPFLMELARLNPAVDLGATLAQLVRGKGDAFSALAFLPFLGWGKKVKAGATVGAKLLKAANKVDEPFEGLVGPALRNRKTGEILTAKPGVGPLASTSTSSALKAAERKWAEGMGGAFRAAPPMPLARRAAHEAGELSVPFFRQYPHSRADDRLADEMFRSMERFQK